MQKDPLAVNKSHLAGVAALASCALALTGCSILRPQTTGLGDNIEVTSSAPATFEAREVEVQEINSDLGAKVKDEGLNVEWELQGVYSSNNGGAVVTIKVHNLNDVALPKEAIAEPTLERADGNGGWSAISLLPYDPEVNADIAAPGLDYPLGAGASTNLQYRFDVSPGNLWNSRLSIGNVRYIGDLNL